MLHHDRFLRPPTDDPGSVLDRLIVEDAKSIDGSRSSIADGLVRSLSRDLEWLLNGRQPLDSSTRGRDEVGPDVITWGLPDLTELDLAGQTDQLRLAHWVAAAIARFEPRLNHVQVAPVTDRAAGLSRTTLRVTATLRLVTGAQPLAFDTFVSWQDHRVAVQTEGT